MSFLWPKEQFRAASSEMTAFERGVNDLRCFEIFMLFWWRSPETGKHKKREAMSLPFAF